MYDVILTGFLLGIASNLHCIGMCGPIAMAIPVNRKNNATILFGTLEYNGGRIIVYTLLGSIIGSIGLSFQAFGLLQWLSIAAGVGLILFAWRKYFKSLFILKLPNIGIQSFLSKNLGKVIRSKSPFKLIFLGGLNGLLPCGMVFLALMNAMRSGDMLYSGLAMMAFGVATLPSMIAVTFLSNKVNQKFRQKANKLVPVLLTLVGIMIVLRGMNLNIPYISPEIKITESTQKEHQNIDNLEMSCCHSQEKCK